MSTYMNEDIVAAVIKESLIEYGWDWSEEAVIHTTDLAHKLSEFAQYPNQFLINCGLGPIKETNDD